MIKLFISHASEDKADFVRPLAERLKTEFQVWYDEYELTVGDKLREKIDQGLRQCDYGVVVLSHHFFGKRWTQEELDGLFSLETIERKVILPVWKDITVEDVKKYSPILANRVAVSTDRGIEGVVHEIKKAVDLIDRYKSIETEAWKAKYSVLDKDITHKMKAQARFDSVEGVQQVSAAARSMIADAKSRVEQLNRESDFLKMEFVKDPSKTLPDSLFILGPFLPYSESTTKPPRLSLRFFFRHELSNSLRGCELAIDIARLNEQHSWEATFDLLRLVPKFDREFNVYWESRDKTFNDGSAILDFAFDRFAEILRKEADKAGSYRY